MRANNTDLSTLAEWSFDGYKKPQQILYAMSVSHLTKQLGIASVCFGVVYTAFLVFDLLNIRKFGDQICLTISTFSFSLVLFMFFQKVFWIM